MEEDTYPSEEKPEEPRENHRNHEAKTITIKKDDLWKYSTFVLVAVVVIGALLMISGGGNTGTGSAVGPLEDAVQEPEKLENSSFFITGDPICKDTEGKPYVILFSTTWCSHCLWIEDTFDSLLNGDFANKINLQHWQLDTGDNTMTPNVESEIPSEISSLYYKYNPQGSIPTFVFGCSYYRVGNGYERQNNLNAELVDFEFVISKLLE
ncbi:MAG: thioredoxin family protein [Nanoarchaeota archaeon]|nr:thioredoxin family protein [Nanoarchaeota archaeon]